MNTSIKGMFPLIPLTDDFIEKCLMETQTSSEISGSQEKTKDFIYNAFLNNDIRNTCTGVLEDYKFEDVEKKLPTVVLQVDEYTDISQAIDDQYKETKNRMMKLKMTDGKKFIYGVEMNHIDGLCMGLKPGFKVVIKNAIVRRGMIYLNNTNIQLLGGSVQYLTELEEKKRSELEKKYRPSYIPSNVNRKIEVPLTNISSDEEDNEDVIEI